MKIPIIEENENENENEKTPFWREVTKTEN